MSARNGLRRSTACDAILHTNWTHQHWRARRMSWYHASYTFDHRHNRVVPGLDCIRVSRRNVLTICKLVRLFDHVIQQRCFCVFSEGKILVLSLSSRHFMRMGGGIGRDNTVHPLFCRINVNNTSATVSLSTYFW